MTHGGGPGRSGCRRGAEGGDLAAASHRWLLWPVIAAAAGCCGPVLADDSASRPAWYIVGGPEAAAAATPSERRARADFGITLGDMVAFTAGAASPDADPADGYSLLVSGSYGFETGTLVTPRIVGGVGVSAPGAGRLTAADPTAVPGIAPTARIGFGADFDLGGALGVSAEYSATYLGEAGQQGQLGESRLDQKFTVGAKIRF